MKAKQAEQPVAPAGAGTTAWRWLAEYGRRGVAPQLLIVLALYFVGTALIPGFGSALSVKSQLVIAAFLGVVAAGECLVILAGGMDISVANMISCGNVITAVMQSSNRSIWLIVAAIVGLGIVVGLVNGGVSRLFHTHSLVVSLAVGAVLQGALLVTSHGGNLSGTAPSTLTNLVAVNAHLGPLPIPPIIVIWAALTVVLLVFLARTRLGREIYAIGANEKAAAVAGINPWRPWLTVFCLSGVLAGLAGFLLTGFTGTADVSVGDPYLFTTIAAVVVGGTSLVGGRGGYGRTVLGVLILTEIQTLVLGKGGSTAAEEMFLGVVVVLLVAIYGRERYVGARM